MTSPTKEENPSIFFFLFSSLFLPLGRVFLPLLLGFGCLSAQTPNIQQEIHSCLESFHLNKAERLLPNLNNPPLEAYYQIRILFLKLIATEDLRVKTALDEKARDAISIIEELPEADCRREVMIGEIFLLRGASKIIGGSMVGGGWDISKGCERISNNVARFQDCPEQLKMYGLLQVAGSSIPKKWQWLSEFLCVPSNLKKGLANLVIAGQSSTLIPEETQILQFYLEKNLLSRQEEARKRIKYLHSTHPGAFLYTLLYVSALQESRQNEEALRLIQENDSEFKSDTALYYSPLWDFFAAKSFYFKLDFSNSISAFNRFLLHYKGRAFFADALFRKGMAFCLSGNYAEGKKSFDRLVKLPSSGFDEDDYAMAMARNFSLRQPSETELQLFRARNLFDGGYYKNSLEILQALSAKVNLLREDEKTELFYRIGRNYQEFGQPALAEKFYLQCIGTHPTPNLWMKVYAHYYLGMIAKNAGKLEEARNWMALALGFSGYYYQSGLEQRCKAALQSMKSI